MSEHNNSNNKKRTDFLPKIFSVIAAVILWFYVIDVRTTTEEITVYDVPIDLNNFTTTDGLDIVSGKDFTVDVLVRGKKSDISEISPKDIYASVDMSGINLAGTYKMDVAVSSLKKGITIVNKNVSQINVNVDSYMACSVPLEPIMYYTIEEDVYQMGTPSLSLTSIRISGPKRIVDSVVKAKIEVNAGKIENNITYKGKAELYDANDEVVDSPYIKIHDDVIMVEIPVTKKELKNVVPVFYNKDFEYDYVVTPSQVYVKGNVNSVKDIKYAVSEPITEIVPSLVVKRLDLPVGVNAYDENDNLIDTVRIEIISVFDTTIVENVPESKTSVDKEDSDLDL